MFEIAYIEISSSGKLTSKRRSFKTEAALNRFIDKLYESGKLYQILGTRS